MKKSRHPISDRVYLHPSKALRCGVPRKPSQRQGAPFLKEALDPYWTARLIYR